jgi:hypothetical protein
MIFSYEKLTVNTFEEFKEDLNDRLSAIERSIRHLERIIKSKDEAHNVLERYESILGVHKCNKQKERTADNCTINSCPPICYYTLLRGC